jgi:hypothetical protein
MRLLLELDPHLLMPVPQALVILQIAQLLEFSRLQVMPKAVHYTQVGN